jgi:hypothetical protein
VLRSSDWQQSGHSALEWLGLAKRPPEVVASPTATVEDVLAHPFWRQRPQKEQLEMLIDAFSPRGPAGYVAFNDRLVIWHCRPDGSMPANFGKRYIVFVPRQVGMFTHGPGTERDHILGFVKMLLDKKMDEKDGSQTL